MRRLARPIMATASYLFSSKEDRRLHAVLAPFKGESAAQICSTFRIARSDLYKFRARALAAMRQALVDQHRGPKRAQNRLAAAREQQVVSSCQRHPTRRSYRARETLGPDAPSARTIQRIRIRHGLARLPKRAPPSVPVRRVPVRIRE